MDKQEVIDYLMYTPYNTNLAVLKSMLGDGDWDELLDYVKRTSHRMNRRVLGGILGADDYIVLLDGTYTFDVVNENQGEYYVELGKYYSPSSVIITVDGTTVTLPLDPNYDSYGEFDDNGIPVFTTYPAIVYFKYPDYIGVGVADAGEHTIKVIVPNGSEIYTGDFDDGMLIAVGDLTFAGEGQASAKPFFNTFMEPDSIGVVINDTSYSLTKNEDSVTGRAAYYGVRNSNYTPYVEILAGKIPGKGEMIIYLPTAMAAGTYNNVQVYDISAALPPIGPSIVNPTGPAD